MAPQRTNDLGFVLGGITSVVIKTLRNLSVHECLLSQMPASRKLG